MKKNNIIAILLIAITFSGFSQTSAPKYSNEFLNIGVGARSLGMSNSVISSVNNVNAGYYNPAGLLKSKSDFEIGLMHSEYFAGIAKYDYIGLSKRIDEKSVIGLSILRFGTDDIPNTTQLIDEQGNVDYDRITKFSASDYGFLFSYARKLPKGIDVGANFKIIHRRIGDFANAWGFGIDVSVNYEFKNWKFAGVIRDVTSTINTWSFSIDEATKLVFDSTGNDIPTNSTELTLPRIILGSSRYFKLSEKFDLLTEVNFDITFDGKRNTIVRSNTISIDPTIGIDLGYKSLIYLRAGLGNTQWVRQFDDSEELSLQPNIGVGIKLKKFSLDYALTNVGNSSVALYSNVFSLRYSF